MAGTRIIVATGNAHKVEEIRAIFASDPALAGVELVSLPEWSALSGLPTHEPAETGSTFEANAAIKALSYAQQTCEVCLADDSGLEVDALRGRPGVISSHYCTDGREVGMTRPLRDRANNERVLRELEGVPLDQRSARFVCVMALAGASRPWSRQTQGAAGVPPARPPAVIHAHGDLPHFQSDGETYFITFRAASTQLSREERERVLSACFHWHRDRAMVHWVVVMPDHVHLLLRPLPKPDGDGCHSVADLMHSIKSFTAHAIQKSRGAHGSLWQEEYHDTTIRGDTHMRRTIEYIQLNPVRAGLVAKAGLYPYTAFGGTHAGQPSTRGSDAGWCTIGPDAHGRAGRPPPLESEEGSGAAWEQAPGLEATHPPPTLLHLARATCEGRIGLPPRVPAGEHGFGYDPLFLVAPGFDRASAELTPQEKHAISHRGHAARAIASWLRERSTRP
jgi:non-canonical purine NTP pyrophosphatase (RdgB/HAM1 family)